MAEQWLSIVEYARTFQLSDMTVRRRIKTGRLHAVLKEGKYFIPISLNEARSNQEPSYDDSEYAPNDAAYTDIASNARSFQRPSSAPPSHLGSSAGNGHRSGDMQVIKGHPAAHKTYQTKQAAPQGNSAAHQMLLQKQRPAYSPPPPKPSSHVHGGGDGLLPHSLRRPLQDHEHSLVDTRALLAFCEASLRKINESERRVVEKFKARLEALEATLGHRDAEIKSLHQQVEDLQLLVKVLEKKKPG